jgi:hypothetical protein
MAPAVQAKRGWLGWLGVVVALLVAWYGFVQVANWWAGEIFFGSGGFSVSDRPRPRVYALTDDNDPRFVLVRVPQNDVAFLTSGGYGGYQSIELTFFLPDMVPESIYDSRHPGAENGDNISEQKRRDEIDITLEQANIEPDDPTGQIGYVDDNVQYARKSEIFLRDNPYSDYDAYLFTETAPVTLEDKDDTITDFIPKKNQYYYISCLGEPISENRCDILYIYDKKYQVDIEISSLNIPSTDMLIKQANDLLKSFYCSPSIFIDRLQIGVR